MSDPAGWYPDPTTRHELRYWDGYAWLDNVSDKGAASSDPLGGKPMPAPSDAAAKAQAAPPPAPESKTPLYVGIAVVAVVAVAVAAFLLTRGSGGGGQAATALKDKAVTLKEKGDDPNHPTVFPVTIPDNTVVVVDVKPTDKKVTAGVIIEAKQDVIDKVNAKISDVSDLLQNKLKDACTNLREEDLGAKGDVAYFFDGSHTAGEGLHTFTVVPIGGAFEFIPVVVDDSGNCKGGELEMTLTPHFLDLSKVSTRDDLQSALTDDSDLQDFVSS